MGKPHTVKPESKPAQLETLNFFESCFMRLQALQLAQRIRGDNRAGAGSMMSGNMNERPYQAADVIADASRLTDFITGNTK